MAIVVDGVNIKNCDGVRTDYTDTNSVVVDSFSVYNDICQGITDFSATDGLIDKIKFTWTDLGSDFSCKVLKATTLEVVVDDATVGCEWEVEGPYTDEFKLLATYTDGSEITSNIDEGTAIEEPTPTFEANYIVTDTRGEDFIMELVHFDSSCTEDYRYNDITQTITDNGWSFGSIYINSSDIYIGMLSPNGERLACPVNTTVEGVLEGVPCRITRDHINYDYVAETGCKY